MKQKRKLNKTSLFILVMALILLAMNITLGALLTRISGKAMKQQIRDRMLDISNTAAAMLDGDALMTIEAKDEDTPEYQAILKTLTYFQDNIELKYIYCVRGIGDKQFVFTVDPTVEDPGQFGEPIVYTDALYTASLGTAAVDETPYEDKWGRFYSAYSPVFTSDHRVGGIVAVDFSAEWYDNEIADQIRIFVVTTVVSLFFGIVLTGLIASTASRRIHALYQELNNLSDGIETLANELSRGEDVEGIELLHADTRLGSSPADEVDAISAKIRSLEEYMGVQINAVRAKAYVDELTGLENRTAYLELKERLDGEIAGEKAAFSLAMFDINGLKSVNDQQGHEAGDRMIQKAANLLQQAFATERLFRIGGDEFVVVSLKAYEEFESLFKGYEKAVVEELKEKGNFLLSAGYAEFDQRSDRSVQDVLSRADTMMYSNKRAYYESTGNRRRS